MFLEFFEGKAHIRMKSFSLIPQNDKSLLLINAGMAPLKPYFTGQEVPPAKRVCTCQKCVRTGDIENVGKTARHLTFFEMLGNFSFGDYFKEEAIAWSWEFLTKVIGLQEDRLYPSIFNEDEEAFEIWNQQIGIPKEKIFRFYRDENGKCDNFWEHGAGPCGPCSEIYYDRGEKYGCGSPDCTVGCECDRYMEVWNNVFTQFEGDGKGHYEKLNQKNIDTGMGLERLAIVVQEADTIFDIDTMRAIRDAVCDAAKVTYGKSEKEDTSIRLITDHIRSSTFLISDGVMPSNEGRGYVLRRLIRRAARHGRLLNIEGAFLWKLCQTVIEECKDGYPELEEKRDFIVKVFSQEEEKFDKTIDQGLSILNQIYQEMSETGVQILSGETAFKLYDTYGFPLDLTIEIMEEKGCSIDTKGFEEAMLKQRKQAKAARKVTNYMGADVTLYEGIDVSIQSVFTGYEKIKDMGMVLALTDEEERSGALVAGQQGTIITDRTPFYATSGGQAADIGSICGPEGEFTVKDTVKLNGNKIGHLGVMKTGMIKEGDSVTLLVDVHNRRLTEKNHSATHLLQKALRMVLGSHVEQAGSDVNAQRLRFDFSHFAPLSKEELRKVEELVNEQIQEALSVCTEVMSIEDAKKTGAMALFGEKYGEQVRVVRMGDFSTELCGGTHVANTAGITAFKILSETGVAAGVRRIEALTSEAVLKHYEKIEDLLEGVSGVMKCNAWSLLERVELLQQELKSTQSELESLKSKEAREALGDSMDEVVEINGVKLLAVSVPNVDMNGLRDLCDQLKDKLGQGVIVLASSLEEKVNLVVMATEEAIKCGAHAGNLIKGIAGKVGGGGGGRPNMAQAGGKNPQGIQDALKEASIVLTQQVLKK
ncbi:MAG: alanine--tRNA ligase [Lachnospiraceae bacterium]